MKTMFYVALIFLGGLVTGFQLRDFTLEDSCLDLGGVWNADQIGCRIK